MNITLVLFFFFYPFMVTYNISQRSQSYKDSRTPSVHGSLPSPLTSMTATGRNPALCELNWSSLSIFLLLSWTFRISLTVFYSKHTESMTYSQIRRKSGEYALSCSPFIYFSLFQITCSFILIQKASGLDDKHPGILFFLLLGRSKIHSIRGTSSDSQRIYSWTY